MVNICIGIISYLPDDNNVRNVRSQRLTNLLSQLIDHFNLPILIIAQNWKDFKFDNNLIEIFTHEKLGITRARKELREIFLKSSYDYMIMLDDDMELSDNQSDYDNYLNTITAYKKEYYYVKNFLNNFSVISKEGFKKVDYDINVDPEKGTGYEDWIFNEKCKKTLNNMNIKTSLPKFERSHFLGDKYSTWNLNDSDLVKSNEEKSRLILRSIKNKSSNNFNNNISWF